MLPNLEPHIEKLLFQGAHLIALVPVYVPELRVCLGEFKDVVESERVTVGHDIIVANEAFIEVNHFCIHLHFLLNVKAYRNHSYRISFIDL